jgi:hypothetical protein
VAVEEDYQICVRRLARGKQEQGQQKPARRGKRAGASAPAQS